MITFYYSKICESEYEQDIISNMSRITYIDNLCNFHVVCAADAGDVIGFIIFDYDNNKSIIHYIFVEQKYRRKGVGSCLLNMTLKHIPKKCIHIVSFPLFENKVQYLEFFFKKNNFKWMRNDGSGFIIQIEKWVCDVEPLLRKMSCSSDFICATYNITESQWLEIEKIANADNIPSYFFPNQNTCKYRKNIFYINHNGEIVGWTITTLKNSNTIEFDCTYIIKKYRGLKTVSRVWLLSSIKIRNTYKNAINLLFYCENNNKKLERFYMYFLRNCQFLFFHRAIFES